MAIILAGFALHVLFCLEIARPVHRQSALTLLLVMGFPSPADEHAWPTHGTYCIV